MKKLFILILIFELFSISNSKAELGLGFGSSGISLKPMHQYTVFASLRSGLGAGYSIESFDFSLTPELSANVKFIEQKDYFLYGGFGLKGFTRANIGSNDDIYNFTFYFMMPFGIECKPIPNNDNLAICIETQINFARSGTLDPGVYGVFEIVYYFKTSK